MTDDRTTARRTTGDPVSDTAPDPAEGLRIIAAQTARVRAREADSRVVFALWGVAWLVGYLPLYLTSAGVLGSPGDAGGTATPAPWAYAVLGCSILAAMVGTIVYTVRASAGIRGMSASVGVMFGWSWCIAFVGMWLVLGGLARAGASSEVMQLASNAVACLIVGALYLGCGAFTNDRPLYAIGVWVILVAAVAVSVGLPGTYLVMAVLGGGGFLVGALVEHLRRGRPGHQVRMVLR